MASALPTLIGNSTHEVFRRAFIKRRNTSDGKYESTWTDISDFVKSWGNFKSAVDDIRLNRFSHSGLTLKVRNDTGAFNPETDVNSLWYETLSRYQTLVKIEAGYIDEDDNELPTDTSQGIFVLSDEVPRSAKTNEVILNCKSLVSVFADINADEVSGLGATQTGSDLIAKIRDHTDGAGNFIFREFITSTSWTIQTTTVNYDLATSTSGIENMSTWEFMNKIAECEGYVLLINRQGGLEFRNRTERTTTAAFSFRGQGFVNPNVISLNESKEAINKYYNNFRLKYLSADTSTSYVQAGTATAIDPSSTAWKYGNRTYKFENKFFVNTSNAQAIVNNLRNEFSTVNDELNITAKFTPQLEVLDKVTLNYHSYDLAETSIWDQFDWASASATAPDDGGNWALEDGENFDYDNIEFKVLSRKTDLDKFTTTFQLRRI